MIGDPASSTARPTPRIFTAKAAKSAKRRKNEECGVGDTWPNLGPRFCRASGTILNHEGREEHEGGRREGKTGEGRLSIAKATASRRQTPAASSAPQSRTGVSLFSRCPDSDEQAAAVADSGNSVTPRRVPRRPHVGRCRRWTPQDNGNSVNPRREPQQLHTGRRRSCVAMIV